MSKALERGEQEGSNSGSAEGDWESRTVQDSGEVTIPKDMRDKYGLHPGEEVVAIDEGDGVKIKKPEGLF